MFKIKKFTFDEIIIQFLKKKNVIIYPGTIAYFFFFYIFILVNYEIFIDTIFLYSSFIFMLNEIGWNHINQILNFSGCKALLTWTNWKFYYEKNKETIIKFIERNII